MAKKVTSKKKASKNYEALRKQAEMMFIDLGMTAKAIADQLNVTEKTVGGWRADDNWDKRREELFASPHKIKELLLKEYQSIASGNEAKLNADAISKISKALETVDNKVNPRIAMTIVKMLDDYTADINPELASKSLEVHKMFINHIIDIYG